MDSASAGIFVKYLEDFLKKGVSANFFHNAGRATCTLSNAARTVTRTGETTYRALALARDAWDRDEQACAQYEAEKTEKVAA